MGASYDDFLGDWTLRRVVTDGTGRHTMTGTARLADGVLHEAGVWTGGAYTGLRAERRYLWRPGVDVLFEDGRFFHRFDPGLADQRVAHWCDPDHYEGHYRLDLPRRFHVTWRVQGPRKAYVSATDYLRSGAGLGR